MKKLIILIIVLLFVSPVIAFDFPKMRDPLQQNRLRFQQYLQRQEQAAMERKRQRQAQELIILQKKQQKERRRQIQEIINIQCEILDMQREMKEEIELQHRRNRINKW